MFQSSFGRKNQVKFNTVSAYYELLGYLAKSDGSTRIVLESNDDQGAWGKEGRIEFYKNAPTTLKAKLLHTAGTSSVISRVNCLEFVEHLMTAHRYKIGGGQDVIMITKTIPINYLQDFQRGLSL